MTYRSVEGEPSVVEVVYARGGCNRSHRSTSMLLSSKANYRRGFVDGERRVKDQQAYPCHLRSISPILRYRLFCGKRTISRAEVTNLRGLLELETYRCREGGYKEEAWPEGKDWGAVQPNTKE